MVPIDAKVQKFNNIYHNSAMLSAPTYASLGTTSTISIVLLES